MSSNINKGSPGRRIPMAGAKVLSTNPRPAPEDPCVAMDRFHGGKVPPKSFTPGKNLIAVYKHPTPQVSDGGVALTERASQSYRSMVFTVIATGPECKQVKEGDTIIILPEERPFPVKLGGDSWLVFPEEAVMGIMNEPIPIPEASQSAE
jgi:co-chaperonin GroES (HSP10)